MLDGGTALLVGSLLGVVFVRNQTLHHIAVVICVPQDMSAALFHRCAAICHDDGVQLIVASLVRCEFGDGRLNL